MLPRLPLVGLPTYGLMVAIGFVVALVVAWRLASRLGLAPDAVQDVMVWASIAGLVGAKLLLVVLQPETFLAAPWELLFQGGVFYGGFVAGAVVGWLRCRRLGLEPWRVGDVIAPSLALAHAFGRMGCLLAGCCWGKACSLPWAIAYTNPLAVAVQSGLPLGERVHPTQAYEVLGDVGLAAAAWFLARRGASGVAWWSYVLGYAVLRFLVEMVRGDERGHVGPLSTSQAVALAGIAVATTMLIRIALRARRSQRAASAAAAPAP